MPLRTGERIGAYEITGALGKGGMGEVYRGRDTKLDREVAVKVLPDALARDPERLIRFEREAKALAALNHPNIAQIYAVEGTAFIMELVPGETLGERIKRGAIPVDEVLPIASQMASALDAAHEKGIIHRDFKPGNVMVTPDGVVKVLDFGLVGKAPSTTSDPGQNPEDSPTLTLAATQAGFIMGTAAYMAPEQASGKPVDKRADIWAFGVVLWEMLTGKRLFEGETVSHVLAAVLTKEPDLAVVPVRVQPLLQRCLEKDPKKRLRDIGDAMSLVTVPGSLDPAGAGSRTRGSTLHWVLAGMLAVVSGVLLWLVTRPEPSAALPEITRFEIHAPPGATIPLGTPAVSPDGRAIAYVVAEKDGVLRIYLRRLDEIEPRPLPGTEGALHPFFSPDGRAIGFSAAGQIKIVDVASGALQAIKQSGGPWHGTWGREGILLLDALYSATGGQIQAISPIRHPYFLPDGKRYLALLRDGLHLNSLGSKDSKILLPSTESAGYAASAPDGLTYIFFAQGGSVMAQRLDDAAGKLTGSAEVILNGVGRQATPPQTMTLGVSNSGTIAYQRGAISAGLQLGWVDRTGKPVGELPPNMLGNAPVLSPDGKLLLVQRATDVRMNDIWVLDPQRNAATRLTFGQFDHQLPQWMPGGKEVSYYVGADNGRFVRKNASGQGQEVVIKKFTEAETRYRIAGWSPVGKLALWGPARGATRFVPVENGQPAFDKVVGEIGPKNAQNTRHRFSPDGKYVAYESDESGADEVYVEAVPPATGRWQVSVAGGNMPVWRRDGKELFFRGTSNGGLALMAADVYPGSGSVSFGTPHPLFNIQNNGGYDVSLDGQRFLFSRLDQASDQPIIVVQNWWVGLKKK